MSSVVDVSTPESLEESASEFLAGPWSEAWNSRDPEQVLALMTDDIEYRDSAWPRVMKGHDDVREFLDVIWTTTPDLELKVVEGPFVLPGEPKVTFTWRGECTVVRDGDPMGRIDLDGFELDEYRDGKVSRLWICFNPEPIYRLLTSDAE